MRLVGAAMKAGLLGFEQAQLVAEVLGAAFGEVAEALDGVLQRGQERARAPRAKAWARQHLAAASPRHSGMSVTGGGP